MITQTKGAAAMRDPPQPLAGGVRSLWVGISGSNDFGEQCQSRIAHFVFFHNGVERYVLAMMPNLSYTIPSVILAQSVWWGRRTNSASGSTNFFNQPWTGDAIDLYSSRVIHFINRSRSVGHYNGLNKRAA